MIRDNNLSNSSVNVFRIYKTLLKSPSLGKDLRSDFSNDTLDIYLNTLRALGIKISVLKKPYRYYISENLNLTGFDKSDIKLLANIKKFIGETLFIENVIAFNNFLKVLSEHTDKINKIKLERIINSHPFSINSHENIKLLQESISTEVLLHIGYNSPKSGKKIFKVIPIYLNLDNNKLYLWCKDENISDYRCLRIDRITSITPVNINVSCKNEKRIAICKIKTAELESLKSSTFEIIKKSRNETFVKFYYSSEFELFQKILYMGTSCKIIEPLELKKSFKNILQSIKELYE